MAYSIQFSLHGGRGERKYLNAEERRKFYSQTKKLDRERKVFCQLLYFTGARFGEIHSLYREQINLSDRLVTIKSLKRRRDDIFRQIPIPDHLIEELKHILNVPKHELTEKDYVTSIWSFSRRTGSRLIKQIMHDAGIDGIKASALGLRHGYAVHAAMHVPLTKVQKWMGHAYLATTAIYLDVSGIEERKWAEKLWFEEE